MMTGMRLRSRMRRQTSSPSIRGNMTSRKTASKTPRLERGQPRRPVGRLHQGDAVGPEVARQQLEQPLVVLDAEHPQRHGRDDATSRGRTPKKRGPRSTMLGQPLALRLVEGVVHLGHRPTNALRTFSMASSCRANSSPNSTSSKRRLAQGRRHVGARLLPLLAQRLHLGAELVERLPITRSWAGVASSRSDRKRDANLTLRRPAPGARKSGPIAVPAGVKPGRCQPEPVPVPPPWR